MSLIKLKRFEYKKQKYEIRVLKRPDGTIFAKDFKDGQPFSPYYFGLDKEIDISKFEKLVGSMVNFLIVSAEESAKSWHDNKDKINLK